MDIIRDHQQVSRLEIVDRGRRRRFSDEAKLAIVAESLCGPRQVTVTAQRHGIKRFQLNSWRKAAREGRLGNGSPEGFVSALVVPTLVVPERHASGEYSAPIAPTQHPMSDSGRMEVVSANGRRVVVDQTVDVEALLRIIRGLETL
ncbi:MULTISPECIES: IS66-like element accessory protein TnpA [Rhizobium]|uniref:Transposase n=1 Tax=Rhizobium aouanii TaxID=3118145 RepID=A0ABU8CK04_9HYPH|nr:transposase [Rhizobium acaciae]MCW1410831.1 transposase [Rhizobium acaciae]MCW1742870.1 transposase [Rhizobium acaciae]MCW1750066.1 transposase [Rhizobium acaciae]